MRIGIYNPYFNSLGGGERYCLTLASHWSKYHDVFVFWQDKEIIKKAELRFGIDLSRVHVVDNIFLKQNFLNKLYISKTFDLIFFLSDGSVPISFAKRNIIHFQRPFPLVNGKSWWNKYKLSRFNSIVCNSFFTKKFIDEEYGVNSIVIYPPVGVLSFKGSRKEKIILSVGRFASFSINKKQKEMVEFFKKILQSVSGWELQLTGGLLDQDKMFFDQVADSIENFPIRLFPNDSFENLKKNYSKAMIYWHAAGFGEDEDKNPAAMEHFGITTVEAMAAGCVPVVYDAGGQREIIQDGINGFLWKTPEELIEKTLMIINHTKLRIKLSNAAIMRSKEFNVEKFERRFDELLNLS